MEISFINNTKENFLQKQIKPRLLTREKCFIVTANPEIVMETQKNKEYRKVVKSADFVIPDGVGIILAARHKKEPLQERIAGFDLMKDMLKLANDSEATCFFLGTSKEANQAAVKNIMKAYPRLKVAGSHHGYFEREDSSIGRLVQEAEPDFIFVALGYPRQEEWIYENLNRFSKGIFMGVGG